jgi:hypothetical protein
VSKYRVRLDGEKLDHVAATSDGWGVDPSKLKSLCGRSPWPDSWSISSDEPRPLCMGCAAKLRGR